MRLKNEVTVGVIVVAAILVVVFGAFWMSNTPFGAEQREITAVFREVGELREGNPVKLRGVEIGRITGIGIGQEGLGVLVTMDVRPDATLPPDAAVLLAPASLFGDWQAAVVSPSAFPEVEFTAGAPPNILPGAALPDITELTAVGARIAENIETLAQRVELAFTEETALKMRETVENFQGISEQMAGFVDQQTRTYAELSENLLLAAEDASLTVARVGAVATDVEAAFAPGGQVQQILTSAQRASANLERLSVSLESSTQGIPGMVARADTTLATISELTESATTLLDTLEPQIADIGPTIAEARTTLATVQRLATRLEQGDGTIGRLMEDPALYEEMQASMATLRRILADIQANPGRYIGEIF